MRLLTYMTRSLHYSLHIENMSTLKCQSLDLMEYTFPLYLDLDRRL